MTAILWLARRLGLLGRTSRSSFVGFLIWCFIGGVVLSFWQLFELKRIGFEAVLSGSAAPPLPWLPWLQLGARIAFLWIAVRRFHDQDRPGWLAILPDVVAIPFVAGLPAPGWLGIPMLILFVAWLVALFLPGTIGPNRYGPDPRGWRSRDHYLEQQKALRS